MNVDFSQREWTQAALAQIIGVTRQAVADMEQRGVIARSKQTLHEALLAYLEHLRTVAAGRGGSLVDARTRLTEEQTEAARMKNAHLRGELAHIHLLSETVSRAAKRICDKLDAIPAEIRRRGDDVPEAVLDLVTDTIAKARHDIASEEIDWSYLDSPGDESRDSEGGEGGAENVPAAAEANALGVG